MPAVVPGCGRGIRFLQARLPIWRLAAGLLQVRNAPARRTRGRSCLSMKVARLVFVPTGSASPDFFGGERPGDNRYANSLVALRAVDGKVVWHHQLVHHDVWDYDVAAQPMLIDIEREGKSIAAVVQATKTGMLFVFDRETGEPVFQIIERPVPRSDVEGESTAPTQPFPATPALVSHAAVTPNDAWGLTFYDRGRCRDLIEKYRSEGIYTPPSLQGSIMSPGYVGGVNWGSLAFDNQRQLVVAAVNHLPTVVTLIPRDAFDARRKSGEWPDSDFARQRARPMECVARCCCRHSACRAPRRRGERLRPSICGATRFAGRPYSVRPAARPRGSSPRRRSACRTWVDRSRPQGI